MIKRTKEDRINMIKDLEIFTPEQLILLNEMGFFTAPASTKWHGDYEGGLFDHSWETAQALDYMTDRLSLKWVGGRDRSPWIVGLLHDLCKCDAYFDVLNGVKRTINDKVVYEGKKWEHNPNTLLKGHGEKSVMLASTLMELTMEEVLCIRYHMGAYMTDDWNQYDLAIKKYPNVLYTHTADMIASKIVGV